MFINKLKLIASCALTLTFLVSAHAAETTAQCAQRIAAAKFATLPAQSTLSTILRESEALYTDLELNCWQDSESPFYHVELHEGVVRGAEQVFDMRALILSTPFEHIAMRLISVEIFNHKLFGNSKIADHFQFNQITQGDHSVRLSGDAQSAAGAADLTCNIRVDASGKIPQFRIAYHSSFGEPGEEPYQEVTLANLLFIL